MRFLNMTWIIALAGTCLFAGCKEEEELVESAQQYSPEVQKLRTQINRDGSITRALNAYSFGLGTYPTTEQGLQALLSRPSGLEDPAAWQGPYLEKEEELTDPWGNQIKYVYPGKTHEKKYDIISAGPDGQFDTDDDILSWDVQ